MMKKLTAILCAACLMLTAMTGCTKQNNPSQSGGSGDMIALITMDSIDQHWITLNEGRPQVLGPGGVVMHCHNVCLRLLIAVIARHKAGAVQAVHQMV